MTINIKGNIKNILIFYDRPILFTSSIDNKLYICVLLQHEQSIEKWLVTEIDDFLYKKLIEKEIDFYECFKSSKTERSYILFIKDQDVTHQEEINSLEIPDRLLPQKGVFYRNLNKNEDRICINKYL
ncbi:TPA: hypothetical protein RJE00_000822 [Legionella pneumophila]|nr:hypothetical protein [Legionella pneumophila]HDV5843305.1 hypothetical protein [Legionella pneumophila]HDV5849237.1 hypothetical protein [Legionella pneumophila]